MDFSIHFVAGDLDALVAQTRTYEAARDIVDGLVLLNSSEGELGGSYLIFEGDVAISRVANQDASLVA